MKITLDEILEQKMDPCPCDMGPVSRCHDNGSYLIDSANRLKGTR